MRILFIGLMAIIAFASNAKLSLSDEQLRDIGQKIYLNETGGNDAFLVAWNRGEDFASLGIGHFIWFPKDLNSRFIETFPDLVTYFIEQDVDVPEWLKTTKDNPWNSLQEFEAAKDSEQMHDLRNLMQSTFVHQISFIHNRMQKALPAMLETIETPEAKATVKHNFSKLEKSELGMYALIDYVNFKGEGISPRERYNGQGWGLKQVLLEIPVDTENIYKSFANACIKVLETRVNNSPQKDVEKRWLPGWGKRCSTYHRP